MRVEATANVRYNTTVRELKEMLADVPDHATVSVRSYTADRPGESSYSTLTFRWDIGSG